MGDALIVGRGGGGTSSIQNYKLKTLVFVANTTFTVPKSLGQKFDIRLFGGGGGASDMIKDVYRNGSFGYIAVPAAGGGGFMNNVSLVLKEGERIPITIGSGGTSIGNVTNSNINTNSSVSAGSGGITSFGTYLAANGGTGAKIIKNTANSISAKGGAGGSGGAPGGNGYQFGGAGGGGYGGEFGGGGGISANSKEGVDGGVIFNLETLNYGTHYIVNGSSYSLVINNSGYAGKGGTGNVSAGNGTNTISILGIATDEASLECLGAGIGGGIGGGGGGYGGNGGRSNTTTINSYIGRGGGGANYHSYGGGGGYGKGGYGGGSPREKDAKNSAQQNIAVYGGGGAYGHGGTINNLPTFGGGGSAFVNMQSYSASVNAQNGANGICIITYYAE